MRSDGWDAERGTAGGASVGVCQLADCVVGALQPATKLPSSRHETRDAGRRANGSQGRSVGVGAGGEGSASWGHRCDARFLE